MIPGQSQPSSVQGTSSPLRPLLSPSDPSTRLTWDDAYEALQPHGVSVVGGRVSGVGVAGFTLGGGERFIFPPGLTHLLKRIFVEN